MSLLSSLNSDSRTIQATLQKVQAEHLATELLEYFQSYSSAEMQSYLATNPMGGKNAYPLCAHINLLDRRQQCTADEIQRGTCVIEDILFNEDPVAAIPPHLLPAGPSTSFSTRPNRFYMVQVVDLETMAVRKDVCDQAVTAKSFSLGPNERFLITVGVTWFPPGERSSLERIVASTILARK